MNKFKTLLKVTAVAAVGFLIVAADHIDAPAVAGGSSDITDFYAFQAENSNNLVFVANVQGLLSPEATKTASFDENLMIEINIDTDGDNVEDLVIQAIPSNGKMYFAGPVVPNATGLMSTTNGVATSDVSVVDISAPGASPSITTDGNGIKYFAGPRDDPFFFDFSQFTSILAGNATGFNDPGTDTFAGTNVMSVVVEVPKSMIGGTGVINTWVETKRKQ